MVQQAKLDVTEVSLKAIETTGLNPRKHFDEDELKELAASIREMGILEPLIVRKRGQKYELVAGERRLRAAKLAGLKVAPVWIREIQDHQILEIMLTENVRRASLLPLEEAEALDAMIKAGTEIPELARRLGTSANWIRDRLKLLVLPAGMKGLVNERVIPVEAAVFCSPFVASPVLDKVSKELCQQAETTPRLQSQDVRQVLDEHIGRLPGPVLNFDVLDRQFGPAWCREFDQSECRKCKRTIKHKTSYGITVRLCLDTECFNPKIKAAKAAVMPAAAAWGSDDSLDSLNPHRYRILPNNLFDAQVCKGCPDCVTGKLNGSKRTICKRPRCHDHLREQARAVLQQRYKTYSEHIHIKLLEQMDAAGNSLASVPPLVLRALLLATAYPLDIDDNFLSILRNIDSKTAATHVISLIAENYIKEMGSDELNILRDAMPELFEGLAVDTEPPLIPRLAISKEDE